METLSDQDGRELVCPQIPFPISGLTLLGISYQHVVLDIKKQDRPKENLGGIIADQMGLGKTLSMLAAISLTRNAAAEFAGDTVSSSMEDRPKTKATLIIVPSACKSP